ncbi:hypothetical protein D0864_08324 [Hortaea werneckii]|uniref:Translocation protein sec66 n=1 Tax=Hortaea werneckii TaxID=91943 RepID=A0A3M7EYK4_HORWE|nr:hypothetical protein KC352_g31062 [Hortaea werneckii]KAI7556626.1 hypothetical protein KC317_g12142 [Hortaea werneckii]KAI7595562.1 hypothetical protein KC346_g15376 [Hortaea werneckii]KAI7649538.1 hypothetical protein KC319_g11233 [Hortaea werneckii]RMY81381.1 hypothetical protein D0864_08324 [Hortaea werneckii]
MDDNATNSTNGTFTNGTSDGTFTPPPPKSFWTNLTLPTLYLIILIGSLYTFSSLYRKRQLAKAAKLEPWFPQHKQRDVYLSLLHMDPAESGASAESEKQLKRVPDSILKAALMRRAVEDIQRIVQLRSSKPALQTLLQRGSVGDELWQRFQRAEQEMEAEVKDVVNEANAFAQGWGQIIFQSANEMNQNRILRERLDEIRAQLPSERTWWDQKRAGIQSEFMKELELDGQQPAEAENKSAGEKKTGSSDDDAVLVDAGGPTQAQGQGGGESGGGGGGGGAKKRKGKK